MLLLFTFRDEETDVTSYVEPLLHMTGVLKRMPCKERDAHTERTPREHEGRGAGFQKPRNARWQAKHQKLRKEGQNGFPSRSPQEN